MKPSPINKVREMYESTADSYAKMMDKEIDLPVYTELLGRLHEQIENTPGALIDTACGSGHMLAKYRSIYDSQRSLIGVDLSPRMVAIANKQLGKGGQVLIGDMRSLPNIESGSVSAVLNFFAIHHLEANDIRTCMDEWYRVLVQGGRLLLAAWEGSGTIDFGEKSDLIALRYSSQELLEMAETAGFLVTRCVVEPVEDFPMDAIYLECLKEST